MPVKVAETGSIQQRTAAFDDIVFFNPIVYRRNGKTVPIIASKKTYFNETISSAIRPNVSGRFTIKREPIAAKTKLYAMTVN